jgi:hypothetical protein
MVSIYRRRKRAINMIRAWVSAMQYLQDIMNPMTADDER